MAEPAALIGVSTVLLHRASRTTTGRTPPTVIDGRRAMRILETESICVAEMAEGVGGFRSVP